MCSAFREGGGVPNNATADTPQISRRPRVKHCAPPGRRQLLTSEQRRMHAPHSGAVGVKKGQGICRRCGHIEVHYCMRHNVDVRCMRHHTKVRRAVVPSLLVEHCGAQDGVR